MRTNREARRKGGAKTLKEKDLCNGPSKLCQAFNIDKAVNCCDLTSSGVIWFEADSAGAAEDVRLVQTTRVGIQGCGPQWSNLPLRWYLLGNPHVSVRDKRTEDSLTTDHVSVRDKRTEDSLTKDHVSVRDRSTDDSLTTDN